MAGCDNDPLHAKINAKLAQIAASSSPSPPWYEAWAALGSDSSEEDRLAVYQAVRDAGSVPEAAGFFLVSWQIDAITLDHAAEALHAYEDRIEAIRRARPGRRRLLASRGRAARLRRGATPDARCLGRALRCPTRRVRGASKWLACSAPTGRSLSSSVKQGGSSSTDRQGERPGGRTGRPAFWMPSAGRRAH